jgi:hypothetical protein
LDGKQRLELKRTLSIGICLLALIALPVGCGDSRPTSQARQVVHAQTTPPPPGIHPLPRRANPIRHVPTRGCTFRPFREGLSSPLTMVQTCFL